MAHTNGIESFWSVLKRAHKGTFHKISPKPLQRYVEEFASKHNSLGADTLVQMRDLVAALVGRNLLYREPVADNGLDNGGHMVKKVIYTTDRVAQSCIESVKTSIEFGIQSVNVRIKFGVESVNASVNCLELSVQSVKPNVQKVCLPRVQTDVQNCQGDDQADG